MRNNSLKFLKKIFLLFPFFISFSYANVVLNSSDHFVQGEGFTFSIEAVGNDINFPEISKIDNYSVRDIGTSRSMQNVNGKVINKLKINYFLNPTKSFVLPSFEVIVDGKIFKTTVKGINVKEPQKTTSKNFEFNISLDKNDLYVGEGSVLKLVFKHRKDLKLVDLNFEMPVLVHMWKKTSGKQKSYQEGDFNVQELEYIIFPQKSGNLRIPPIKIEARTVDLNRFSYSLFNPPTNTEKIYSNSIDLNVKDLPQGVFLYGDFEIRSSISKDILNEGEALSYKLEISGNGNFDDIPDFKLNIPNVTIYEDKPKINTKIENYKYKGTYSKSFSIVSSDDFIIPSIELKYFDENTKQVIIKKTEEYVIKVNKKQREEFRGLEKKELEKQVVKVEEKIVYKSSNEEKIMYFIFGIVTSLILITVIFLLKKFLKKDLKEERTLEQKIKASKTKNEILKNLIPYLTLNKQLDDIIFILEKNEENLNIKKIKKEILEILKEDTKI